MSETLRERIQRHEGTKLKLYKDSRGYLTIGTGHCIELAGISQPVSDLMLDEDIDTAARAVAAAFPWAAQLDDARHDVLVEMCFQMGIMKLQNFHHMLTALQAGDYDSASQEMLNSDWHTQTPLRAEELAGIMKDGNSTT